MLRVFFVFTSFRSDLESRLAKTTSLDPNPLLCGSIERTRLNIKKARLELYSIPICQQLLTDMCEKREVDMFSTNAEYRCRSVVCRFECRRW